jgi:hypothetical protein
MAYTIPADTKIVGSGNPPVDMDDVADVLSGNAPIKYNLLNTAFGGVNDGRVTADGVTNGTTTITSDTITFTSADVGKLALITGAADGDATAGNYFAAAIASVTNSTTAVLASAPSFSETGCNLTVGTDNKNAINAWLTACAGARGYAPMGIYCSSGSHTVPGATIIKGDGFDYNAVDTPPQFGTVFAYGGAAAATYFFQLGSTGSGGAGNNNSVMHGIAVDGSNLADSAVLVTGYRCWIPGSQIWRGTTQALKITGGSSWLTAGTVIGQQNLGDCIYTAGGDTHISNCIIRDPGSGGACCRTVNVNDFLFTTNHLWSGGNSAVSSSYPCNSLVLENTSSGSDVDNYAITGNLFDGVYGHSIVLVPTGGGSCRISDIEICGNSFFAVSGFPDNTYYVVYLNTSSSNNVRGLSISGNTMRGVEGGTNSWAGALGWAGAGSVTQFTVANNTGMGVRSVWPSGLRPDGGRHGNVFTATCTTATSIASSNDGTATFSGTGSATTFTITHGLAATPTTVTLTPGSAAAAAPFYWTASSTTITVTYLTAPVSGTNNVVLSWTAVI